MYKNNLKSNIEFIKKEIGKKSPIIIKKFFIGNTNKPLSAALIYINGLTNKNIINRDILNPLMFKVNENLNKRKNIEEYICKKYISMSNTIVEKDINNTISSIKSGKSVILIDKLKKFIIIDTIGGEHRSVSDPINESALRGSREGFVENIETNISILRRRIKDKNLVIENFKIGKRSQTDLAMLYINDIVDKNLVKELRNRLKLINIDFITCTGMLEQYIEENPFSIFPQTYGSERSDIIEANLMEGRIALILNGTAFVITIPSVFTEFFQGAEDYYERTLISCFSRFLRLIAVFLTTTLPSIYLTLIKFNVELIPIKFIRPIIQSREGIALTPFLEISSMLIIVEFLREGGLRLPPKIAQTLSIVGGIIIGTAAIDSKFVSPSTLLIVGITVVSTFLIPNYEMSICLRLISFPMLILANVLGSLGIACGWFFLLVHIFSLENFNIPYFSIKKNDLKDLLLRYPLWQMNKRPEIIPNNNPIRQTNFRTKFWRKKNEQRKK